MMDYMTEVYLVAASALIVLVTIIIAVMKIKTATARAKSGIPEGNGRGRQNKGNRGNNQGAQWRDIQRKERELKKRERKVSDRQGVVKQQEKILAGKELELKRLISEENSKLSEISGLSKDKAKKNLMSNLKRQLNSEMNELKASIEKNARETVNKEISTLIEESLRKHSEESNVDMQFSVFMLPRSEIKSWVIGSSGRNIRTFESATGAKLVISQFSDAVVISSRDRNKIKMTEVALDELISYGKITPELITDKIANLKEEFVEFFEDEV